MRAISLAGLAVSIAVVGCTIRSPLPGPDDAFVDRPDAWFPDTTPPRDVPPPDNTCASVRIDALRVVPRVVLVIDQSGSMRLDFGGVSRWIALEQALTDATTGLVTTLDDDVQFGAVMYTDDPDFLGCPDVVTLDGAMPSIGAVRSMFSVNVPAGNTPTGDTLAYVLANRATLFAEGGPATGDEVVILATDGEPGTCADGADVTGGRALSVASTQAAFDAGIRTYVLSVGTEVANMHLADVADAGVGVGPGDPPAPYWVATDATSLRTAIEAIASGALPCTLELMGTIDPALACEGTVTLGTEPLACGSDWHAVDASHIALSDAACARLRSTTDDLYGTFPCDAVVF